MRLLFFLLLFVTFTCRLSSQISIIGPATPAGDWTTDFTLTQDASNVFIWYGTFSLSANELNFGLNYDWATNYGSASWPNGIGILNGPSIVVPLAGTYTITFNQWNQAYSFTLIDAEFVGVGTTSPIEKLDVAGNIRLIGEIKPGGQSGTANQVLTSNGAGSMTWSNVSTISATDQSIDADNDTRVTVEDAPDNDLVRIYLAGLPKLELDGNMIKPLNSNLATYLGNGAGANTTGNGNTFIGNQAGNANNAGAWNTAISLGNDWSAEWIATGLPDQKVGIPSTQDKRFTALSGLAAYFTANPAKENALLDVTAAIATALHTAVSDARKSVGNALNLTKTKLLARNEKRDSFRLRFRGTINELEQCLSIDDPKWYDFGLNRPADPATPGQPSNVHVTALGDARVLIQIDGARRANSFNYYKQVIGTDPEPVKILNTQGTQHTAENLPAGATVQITVTGVNDAGEGQASELVSVVVG